MKFNERVLELRKDNNLTQEEVAEKLDVSRQTISNWETGSAQPTIDKAIELAQLYNISLDDLVGNTSSNKRDDLHIINKLIDKEVTLYFNHDSEMAYSPRLRNCKIISVNDNNIKVLVNDKKEKYERLFFLKDIVGIELEVD
ncbi:MAG: helix-turn-helix transcriptional regulator [Erysipelotrichales bacterium]